jgi:hypothetical protein
MTTRTTTQRVAAGLLAGSSVRWATGANTTRSVTSTSGRRPPDRRADAQPLPHRSCVHAPPNQREATISTSPPRAAAACSGVTTGRSTPPAGPAPRGRPGRPPEVVGHLGDRVPGLRVCYLVEYAGSYPPRTANCHEEQLDEGYRADNRAQAEHIDTKLAEIDAVIVPAVPDLPPFTLAEGPQGDVECRLHRANLW